MADITFSNTATERRDNPGVTPGSGEANSLKVLGIVSIELAAASQNDTIKFCRIPASARIAGMSQVYWDDLASSGAPTLDMGLASVDSNVTSDPDALSNGHAVSVSASNADLITNHSNFGKKAWEFVNGQTTDPGGELDVYGSIVDAATNVTGTITLALFGYID